MKTTSEQTKWNSGCFSHHISRWKLAPAMSPNSLNTKKGLIGSLLNWCSAAWTNIQTHRMKVSFQNGLSVCFFMSVWYILSSDPASFTTDLQGFDLDRRVRLSSSSSSMVSMQYGSLKPVGKHQRAVLDAIVQSPVWRKWQLCKSFADRNRNESPQLMNKKWESPEPTHSGEEEHK